MSEFDELILMQAKLLTTIKESFNRYKAIKVFTTGRIESRCISLKDNYNKYKTNDQKLKKLLNDDNKNHEYFIDEDTFSIDAVDEVFIDLRGQFCDERARIESLEAPRPSTSAHTTNLIGPSLAVVNAERKLPSLPIPTFNGDFKEWAQFKCLFYDMVVQSNRTDAEKFSFLKNALSGEPLFIIKNLTVSAGKFKSDIWDKLTNHYDNNRRIIHAHVTSLFNLRPIKFESAAALQRLINQVTDSIDSLNALGSPVQHWDHLLVPMVVSKLDHDTRRCWEDFINNSVEPSTYAELKQFLVRHLRTLEAVESSEKRQFHQAQQNKSGRSHTITSQSTNVNNSKLNNFKCSLCSDQHYISFCNQFKSMSVTQRFDTVKSHTLCFNCLGKHRSSDCRSGKCCNICKSKHHTLLHDIFASTSSQSAHIGSPEPNLEDSTIAVASASSHQVCLTTSPSECTSLVLLGTALIEIHSSDHLKSLKVRALIDPGSEASFISESLVQRLKLPRRASSISVTGVGNKESLTKGVTNFNIQSCINHNVSYDIEALILNHLTSYAPKTSSSLSNWTHIVGLPLADPDFASTIPVEILIGADLFSSIIMPGLIKGNFNEPVAQQTTLGWILIGASNIINNIQSTNSCHVSLTAHIDNKLNRTLQSFWEVESVPFNDDDVLLSSEECACENHFRGTHSRDHTGRFILRLPFKSSNLNFYGSLEIAKRFFHRLEVKLSKDIMLAKKYAEFMNEYLSLGHLKVICNLSEFKPDSQSYFIPHHGIIQHSDKFRVVFNASARCFNSVSLNDMLHAGPPLQSNITFVILHWRMLAYVYTTDVAKMYRQIFIHPDDHKFQLILWRFTPDAEISVCSLVTATYGLASSPFQAQRCTRQLAIDEAPRFPHAATVAQQHMYVDDILFGADTKDDAIQLSNEVISMFEAGGFPLRKWLANEPDLLAHIPVDWLQSSTDNSQLLCGNHKLLGLVWHPLKDTLSFSIDFKFSKLDIVTKRHVLSTIATLYDPLGLLSPLIIKCKIFMRRLWINKLDWDHELPLTLKDEWLSLLDQLISVNTLTIPRWINSHKTSVIEVHGFSDASVNALAAVVYLRILSEGNSRVHLIMSKTKVAPVKTLTIPRLELCAAHLLSKLVKSILSGMNFHHFAVHLWADSQVALSWISSSPHLYQVFVSHRISDIQTLCPRAHWHFIEGSQNPADLATRGLTVDQIQSSSLWWNGPRFLSSDCEIHDDAHRFEITDDSERKRTVHIVQAESNQEWLLIRKYSSFIELLRITAWCYRFINNLKSALAKSHKNYFYHWLFPSELKVAELLWIKQSQSVWFSSELNSLNEDRPIDKGSKILKLDPFIDTATKCIRVGGRLKYSNLSPDAKHPFIISEKSHLSDLIITHTHLKALHAGTQLTLALIRESYWIVNGRSKVKSIILKCIKCTRFRASKLTQKMSDLPMSRVTPSLTFTHVGVDYAGPIKLRVSSGRGHASRSGYIAVFVCFATKAVHIEAVSSYDTRNFLDAFKRFISRRGMCTDIYSDQGTNFVGADNLLREMFSRESPHMNKVCNHLGNFGITWHFNPPAAPHMGGLWEASVKACKFHIRRVIGDSTLTYEEMSTLLASVEACMNSRPLCPLTDDPSDLHVLTPSHFLTGRPILCLPEPSMLDVKLTTSRRWLLVNQMRDRFWETWRLVYLQQLQHRLKWHDPKPNIAVGDIVLIKNEITSPAQWPVARVVELHPGPDGLVRSARLKTQLNHLTRPIVKLVLLLSCSGDCTTNPLSATTSG